MLRLSPFALLRERLYGLRFREVLPLLSAQAPLIGSRAKLSSDGANGDIIVRTSYFTLQLLLSLEAMKHVSQHNTGA